MRAYGNNWHDAVMAEIELGSREAHVAMAWEERFSDEINRSYDHGITTMELWHIFTVDDLCEEGHTLEDAYAIAQETPWGPYDWSDQMLAEDEAIGAAQAEFLEDMELERRLRERP